MSAELQNSCCTGLHEKLINERHGHGSAWINNGGMDFLHAGGVRCLQECVTGLRDDPFQASRQDVALSGTLDNVISQRE